MTNEELTKLVEEAWAEAYASAPADTVILDTLEIHHRTFEYPLRIVCYPLSSTELETIPLRLESDAPFNPGQVVEFIKLPFDIVLPEDTASNPGSFQFRIQHAGDKFDEELREAALGGGKITAIYRQFDESTPLNGPADIWDDIKLTSPRIDGTDLIFDGATLQWIHRPFGTLYSPEKYPSISRRR